MRKTKKKIVVYARGSAIEDNDAAAECGRQLVVVFCFAFFFPGKKQTFFAEKNAALF